MGQGDPFLGLALEYQFGGLTDIRSVLGNSCRRQPAGHMGGKGDQQQHIGNHGGIEGVVSQSAIELFTYYDGKGGAQYDQPPRRQWWDGYGDQRTGEQGTAIGKMITQGTTAQDQDQRFGQQGSNTGQQQLDQHPIAKEIDLGTNPWQQGKNDQTHLGGRGLLTMSVRGACNGKCHQVTHFSLDRGNWSGWLQPLALSWPWRGQ